MDLDIYIHIIHFILTQNLYSVKFVNNEDHIINIYFVKDDILGELWHDISSYVRKYKPKKA